MRILLNFLEGSDASKSLFRDDEKVSVFRTVLAEVAKWMERFDCIVVGPGLGRDPFLLVGSVA